MSNEEKKNDPLNVSKGWFSEPNIEFVIEPDEEEKGILERIKYFFTLFF